MTTNVEAYFAEGCGRCPLGGTQDCSVHRWEQELARLRAIILSCGLTEESKWGVPCYTFRNANILLLGAFKEYCTLSFLNGALLQDERGILQKPGAHSQAARVIRFTDVREIAGLETEITAYIFEAVEAERAGLKVTFSQAPEPIPEELQHKLELMPMFKAAFQALTPGRQRGYILYFSAPKQAKTRASRVEKCVPRILEGKGFHDD